ncbi:MAG: hypothetical protein ABMA01_17450 [Chthoniobacteraceae bacterium]
MPEFRKDVCVATPTMKREYLARRYAIDPLVKTSPSRVTTLINAPEDRSGEHFQPESISNSRDESTDCRVMPQALDKRGIFTVPDEVSDQSLHEVVYGVQQNVTAPKNDTIRQATFLFQKLFPSGDQTGGSPIQGDPAIIIGRRIKFRK